MIQQFADWLVYGIFGLDATTAWGEALNFFVYDTIKIIILLFCISFVMGIVNAYFPIERNLLLRLQRYLQFFQARFYHMRYSLKRKVVLRHNK